MMQQIREAKIALKLDNWIGFTEIIGWGVSSVGKLFKSNNLDDLERQIVSFWNSPEEIVRLGQMAFDKLQRKYSSEVIYKKWNDLFQRITTK